MIENTSCPSRWYCSQNCNAVKALKKSLGCQKIKESYSRNSLIFCASGWAWIQEDEIIRNL